MATQMQSRIAQLLSGGSEKCPAQTPQAEGVITISRRGFRVGCEVKGAIRDCAAAVSAPATKGREM